MKIKRTALILLALTTLLGVASQPVNLAGAATPDAPAKLFAYTVQRGDTLATISRKFGVSPDVILDLNNLRTRPHLIFVGETLNLPITMGFTPSYVNAFFYVVQLGDTVQSLNNKFYIDRITLRLVNGLPEKTNVLTPGDTLLIPAGPHRYVAQSGDTLPQIAAMFGAPVSRILRFNAHLRGGTVLFPGQNVFIPIVYDAPFTPIPGMAAAPGSTDFLGEGIGGGGEGASLDPTTGLSPTASSEVARAANANVINAFQTITMPQNVVNLGQPLQIRWNQLRRVRRDPTRPNGAIMTVAIQFRGGTGTVTVQHYETINGSAFVRGLLVTGIYVNAGDKELWNDIEVDIPGECETTLQDQLILTSGIRLEAHVQYKMDCSLN